MKHGKKPTRAQKIRLGQAGLNPENWLVIRQKPDGEMVVIHKHVYSFLKYGGARLCEKIMDDRISVTSSVTGEFSFGKRRWQGEKDLDDDGIFRTRNLADRVFAGFCSGRRSE